MKKKISFYRWYRKRLKKRYRGLKELHEVETRNPTAKFEEDVQIINPLKLSLGDNIYIAKGTILNCGGGEWCNHAGKITIGDQVYIGPYSVLLGAGEIEIGHRCQFGPGVMLIGQSLDMAKIKDESTLDQRTPPHIFGKITIGEEVMIGAGAVILMGVTIGRGAYIAGGCIIKKDVEPYSFVIPRDKYKTINRNSPLIIKER